MKEATLMPSLKRALPDFELLQNFHPISNLPFIGKIIEKVVANQTEDHMKNDNLYETMQSA